jgi:hypothetical protein
MDERSKLKQAIADFELFLSGKRAPALIGHSLAFIVRLDLSQIIEIILNWAGNQEDQLINSLLGARNKVFDIFFYRIVRFEIIYSFFPAFEQALISGCPQAEREHLAALFKQFKWEDIRPIGTIRDQQQIFMMEKRKEISVQTKNFNEDVYKNTTFSVLSADKQYDFNNPVMGQQIAGYQDKVKEIFTDFVDLIKDKQKKKEILLANESDRYNSYQNKEAFKIEIYITQLADLGIALFNDDFLFQSVQIFTLIHQLYSEHNIKIGELKTFQEKGELFDTQKVEDYSNSRANCMLVKQILGLFSYWHPESLLVQLQIEENRRTRRMLLKALECYGRDIYGILIRELSSKAQTMPWFYARNLGYILGRITCDVETAKNQAVDLLYDFWQPKAHRSLINQIITTLGFIGTEKACDLLLKRLRSLEPQMGKGSQSADFPQKIAAALITIETDKALEAAIDFLQRHEQLKQQSDKFHKIYLSDNLVQSITGKIRKELQRLKISFSILGDKETALELLRIIGHMGNETVLTLCKDIIKTLPRKHVLAAEAEKILQRGSALQFYSKDHVLQKLAMSKNLPEMICYISETRSSGRLFVRTIGEIGCEIEFDRGEAIHAAVNAYYLEREDAFYWSFLLDVNDIESIYFHVSAPRSQVGSQVGMSITRPIETLICEGIIQRGEVLQITGNYLSPESRFRQKPVNSFYTSFKDVGEPEKYRLVWNTLAQDIDIATLQQVTHLSKHDVYKILFYFLKQNMLLVDAEKDQNRFLNIEDGIAMLDMNLGRIERRPVMFNFYKTSAEICADLMRLTEDEALRHVLEELRNCYLDHYQHRKVFVSSHRQACQRTFELIAQYLWSYSEQDRQAMLDFTNTTFKAGELLSQPESPEVEPPQTTALEKLENIDQANDPLDVFAGGTDQTVFDQSMVEEMFGSLDSVLGSRAYETGPQGEGEQAAELTLSEESMIKDLFDNIALAYVKPLKDFIRELYRNWEAGRPTSLEWIEVIEPIFTLLSSSSAKMGYQKVADTVAELQKVMQEQVMIAENNREESFDEMATQAIVPVYQKLCELQPKTFALVASEEDLNCRKETLIVKFILKQVPELSDKMIGKILFAGLNTFDKFLESQPEELSALTGIPKAISEDVCMKFYQYRNIYYKHGDPNYQQKFFAMFELNLRLLKEINAEVESLKVDEKSGKDGTRVRKEILKIERQRALWSLFILLCVKEEYDLVEQIQQSVFEIRIRLLEEYMAKLAAPSQVA